MPLSKAQMCEQVLVKCKNRFEEEERETRKKAEQTNREYYSLTSKPEEVESLVKNKLEIVYAFDKVVDAIYKKDPEGKRINQLIRENNQGRERSLKNESCYL